MKKLLVTLVCLGTLPACNKSDQVKVVIDNQSGFDVDSVSVYPNIKGEFFEIKNGDSLLYTADLSEVQSDGAYRIVYRNTSSGEVSRDTFGYYSNGNPLEKAIRYRIEKPAAPVKPVADRIALDLLIEELNVMNDWRYSEALLIDRQEKRRSAVQYRSGFGYSDQE